MKRFITVAYLFLVGYGHAQQICDCYPSSNPTPAYHDQKKTLSAQSEQEDSSTSSKEVKAAKTKEEMPQSVHTFSANVSLVSDYRFRGISQTMRQPAIQGGFDYMHRCGIYLGTWASNVDGTTHFYNNTSIEWDFYGGYKGKFFPCFFPDVFFNFGLLYYYYPGGQVYNSEHTRYNTAELYLELTLKCLSIKYSQTITDYFGINSDNPSFNWSENRADSPNGCSRGSNYIEVNTTFCLIRKTCFPCFQAGKLSLLVHLGHQTVRHYRHLSFTDWKATCTQEFDWFNAFVTYIGTDARHAYFDVPDHAFHSNRRQLGAQGIVFGIIRTF